MAKKTITDLQKKKPEELTTLLAEKREELRMFRFNAKGSRIRNTKEGAMLRKTVARIMTIQAQQKQSQ